MKQFQNTRGNEKHKTVLWFVINCFLLIACQEEKTIQQFEGETQGTTYHITLVDKKQPISKENIDSILHNFDLSLSGYIPNSTVSLLNAATHDFQIPLEDYYFMECFDQSEKIASKTDGLFDPTILPLMELWGFLKDVSKLPTQREIDSVKEFIGFNDPTLYRLSSRGKAVIITKNDPRLKFDFNAIAQGYSVDVLSNYLKVKGYKNFYVEIGGEIYVSGHNPEGNPWRLGVDKPVSSNDGKSKRVIAAVMNLENCGVATSGNYRKFYEKNGEIYAHTLDPKSGYPAENELLSATVIAKNASIADGMATAFMVMGLEKAKAYLKTNDGEDLEVLFIYTGQDNSLESYASSGMRKKMD